MNNRINTLILLLAIFAVSCNPGTSNKDRENENPKITFNENTTDKKLDVLVGGKLFTSFQWPENICKPVLYPIFSSEGTEITRGFPIHPKAGERADHPHQIGMWLTYGNVNGFDFWGNGSKGLGTKNDNGGIIKHIQFKNIKEGNGKASFSSIESWTDPVGNELLKEQTEYHFEAKDSVRIIDRITKLTASGNDVKMPDTKEGMFGIRVARQLELPSKGNMQIYNSDGTITRVTDSLNIGITGNYESSEGIIGEIVWGTRARWMNLNGSIGDEIVSIVICDHPENPNYPTYWHARGYGLFSANPLGVKDFTKGEENLSFSITADKSVTFKYRVIIYSGMILDKEIIDSYTNSFAQEY